MADRIFAIAVLIVGGLFAYESQSFSEKSGMQTFAPSFFPRVIIAIMFGLAVLLFIQSAMKADKGQAFLHQVKLYFRQHWRAPILLFCFFMYLASLPFAGFLPATIVFLLIGFSLLGTWKTSFFIRNAVLSVVLAAAIQMVFTNVLNVYLP